MKRRLKKPVRYSLYGLSTLAVAAATVFLANQAQNVIQPKTNEIEDYQYVSRSIFKDKYLPVINSKTMIIRPYVDSEVKLLVGYYDFQGEESDQRSSLIYYEGTYMPSSGAYYGKDETFDVVSVLDGTVTDVKEDSTLGNSITIEHNNNISTTYQSIKDIQVKIGDEVAQGTIIAKSSTSNIANNLNNHLYFEVNVAGKLVNPETIYEKTVDEL